VVTGGGLVFQGEVDGSFRAYSAIDGKVLWTFDAKSPVMGVPITFSVGGSQYVAVTTGMSPILSYWSPYLEKFGLDPSKQARRVMTFALGAEGKLPPTERGMAQIPDVTDFTLDTKKRTLGYQTYLGACSTCHGGNAVAVAVAPDLRASQIVRTRRAFSSVLKEGLLVTGGMPKFDDLTDDQIDAIQHYLLSRAVESRSQSH
jgi:quinohemoprotein ethanol dehydrogenase